MSSAFSDETILGGEAGFAMTADAYSDWIPCKGFSEVNVHISWVGAGSPVGSWKVEVSNDPIIRKEQDRMVNVGSSGMGVPSVRGANSAAKKIDITSGISPVIGTGFTVSGGSDGETMFSLSGGVPRFFRVWFDYTSGGSAASLGKVYVHKV